MSRFLISCGVFALLLFALTASGQAQTRGLYLVENGTDTIVSVIDGVVTGEIEIEEGGTTGTLEVIWLDASLAGFQPSGIGDSLDATVSDLVELSLADVTTWEFTISSIGEHGVYSTTLALYIGGSLDYTSPAIETHVESPHAEAEGLRIVDAAGDTIVFVNGSTVLGEIEVAHEEETDTLEVFFIDVNDSLFQPEDPDEFYMVATMVDPLIAEISFLDSAAWTFVVSGVEEGMTGINIGIFHDGHLDYNSPEIEVHVEEEHAEPEGLRLVYQSDTLVWVDGSTVIGSVTLPQSMDIAPIDVWFIDIDGDLFQPETAEAFLLVDSVMNELVATTDSLGDWTFQVNGHVADTTSLLIGVYHIDHLDYASPMIPVNITNDCCVGFTGNASGDVDDLVTLTDLTVLVNRLFVTFDPVACASEANANGDANCDLTLTDLTILVNSLFVTFEATANCGDFDPSACE